MSNGDKSEQKELLAFLISKCGGKDAVMLEFNQGKIGQMASSGKTLQDLLDLAAEGGWDEWLLGLKLKRLINIINDVPAAPRAKGKRTRLTQAKKAALYSDVLAFLQDHPSSSKSAIADAVGVRSKKLGPHLRVLKLDGKITSEGERSKTRYSIA